MWSETLGYNRQLIVWDAPNYLECLGYQKARSLSEMNRSARRITAIVKGRVQGVSFRYYTVREARILGLCGLVKNMVDGTVYVVAEGTQEKLEEFYRFLLIGSPSARVDSVAIEWQDGRNEFIDFEMG